MSERLLVANDPLPEELALAARFRFVVRQPKEISEAKARRPNVMTIGQALVHGLRELKSEAVLFLEKDFALVARTRGDRHAPTHDVLRARARVSHAAPAKTSPRDQPPSQLPNQPPSQPTSQPPSQLPSQLPSHRPVGNVSATQLPLRPRFRRTAPASPTRCRRVSRGRSCTPSC